MKFVLVYLNDEENNGLSVDENPQDLSPIRDQFLESQFEPHRKDGARLRDFLENARPGNTLIFNTWDAVLICTEGENS